VGIKALFDHNSALYFKPRLLVQLAPWLYQFWRHCNERDWRHGLDAIASLGRQTFDLIDEMVSDGVQFELHKIGMVYAAKDEQSAAAALAKLQPMRNYGYRLPDGLLLGDDLRTFEPSLSPTITAGFFIEEHWHVRPDSFTRGLAEKLKAMDVRILEGAEVVDFVVRNDKVETLRTAAGEISAGEVVLAAGAWTQPLAAALGISFPMQPGKGYSFFVKPTVVPRHAVLLMDVHVGCTPLGDKMRIGGTIEFSGINSRLDRRRIQNIVTGARECFADWEHPEISDVWTGMRPITPDGLPILDRSRELTNVYVATGHAMEGVTLSPPSGKAIAEFIVTGSAPAILAPFRLDRFYPSRRRRLVTRQPTTAARQ
jgi:D-amino-acid dehydrogenase